LETSIISAGGWRLPQEQHAEKIARTVRHLALQPVWRTIKIQQPDLYKKIEQEYLTALEEGTDEAEARQRLHPDLADLLNQRLAYASDSDVVAYMRISVEEMKVLRQKDAMDSFLQHASGTAAQQDTSGANQYSPNALSEMG